jgi:hypothetical protein
LQCTGAEEPCLVGRQTTGERGNGEDGDADKEEPAAPEEISESAPEQQEATEDEDICGDYPIEIDRGEVEGVLDRRQGDVHDGQVQHHHELCGADHGERHAQMGPRGGRALRCAHQASRGTEPDKMAWPTKKLPSVPP